MKSEKAKLTSRPLSQHVTPGWHYEQKRSGCCSKRCAQQKAMWTHRHLCHERSKDLDGPLNCATGVCSGNARHLRILKCSTYEADHCSSRYCKTWYKCCHEQSAPLPLSHGNLKTFKLRCL